MKEEKTVQFETLGDAKRPAILFFHAMGVTGASSEPVAKNLQARYFCILPTSTVYCAGQKYSSKADEVRQVGTVLRKKSVGKVALGVASFIGADPGGSVSGRDAASRGTRLF